LGTAGAPTITFTGDTNTGIYSPGADQVAISTNGVQRINIEADGDINIDSGGVFYDATNNRLAIGTTSPATTLDVNGDVTITDKIIHGGDTNTAIRFPAADTVSVETAGSERARIDSSGRLLVGTSSTSISATLVLQGQSANSTDNSVLRLCRGSTPPGNDYPLGVITFGDNGQTTAASISAFSDANTWASGTDQPTRLVFSTTADGVSSPTERMRISQDGTVTIGKASADLTAAGTYVTAGGALAVTRSGATPLLVNRLASDGTLAIFYQDSTQEGDISVSGTTVSYNGAHLSRWSQLPGGANRVDILRGSVLSSINEMCEWGNEDNEQLNRMKVSDIEGDKNVSGVFQAWDDNDDTYTNDFYCAMTGDFIIRIAEGVTVQRGDLLMSAGDGTAKPQDDDIIRSKTIAKVTSTHVTCTYDDGSYCVPCVLMAC
jgi:hypothetical protein